MAKPTWYNKPLYRSKNDQIVSGLLGGLAEYLGMNSALLRLIFTAITAFTGFVPGIFIYVIGMIIVSPKR